MKTSHVTPEVKEELISSERIQEKVCGIGESITGDYRGERPLLVGVLQGAVVATSDLMRNIDLPCRLDFMEADSYGNSATSSGEVRLSRDLKEDVAGAHVLLVDDIVDTGFTLSHLRRSLLSRRPASLEIYSLLSKPSRREVEVDVKYLGFEIPDEFVVGYGLDYAGAYRNLPGICTLDSEGLR